MNTTVAEKTPDTRQTFHTLREGLRTGTLVPCLGPGALAGVVDTLDLSPIPADSDSLILAMNAGQPMAPRLMHEFARAAMHVENKKGRSFLERFLNRIYNERHWTVSPLHRWLAGLNLPYVIDCNRDKQMQMLYEDRAHTLIVGTARISAAHHRYVVHQWTGERYQRIEAGQMNTALPILFKPLGSPLPKPSYIASDADFVDYITELMGGFAIPEPLKKIRSGKRYLMLGMNFTRDTERMIVSDLIYGAASPAGWALIRNASAKEQRFCAKQHLQWLDADAQELLPPA